MHNTRIGKCLQCGREICLNCSPDHVCNHCRVNVPDKIRYFYSILAFISKILLIIGRMVLLIGLLGFVIMKLLFPDANITLLAVFLISGISGWVASAIIVPLLNTLWKSLPKLKKEKKYAYNF